MRLARLVPYDHPAVAVLCGLRLDTHQSKSSGGGIKGNVPGGNFQTAHDLRRKLLAKMSRTTTQMPTNQHLNSKVGRRKRRKPFSLHSQDSRMLPGLVVLGNLLCTDGHGKMQRVTRSRRGYEGSKVPEMAADPSRSHVRAAYKASYYGPRRCSQKSEYQQTTRYPSRKT